MQEAVLPHLQNSNLSEANLNGAVLQFADLRGADLTNAITTGANASRANMTGMIGIPLVIPTAQNYRTRSQRNIPVP